MSHRSGDDSFNGMDRREEEQRRAIEEPVAAETALNVEVKDGGVIIITQPGKQSSASPTDGSR